MPLNEKMKELIYDSRLIERYLKEGKIDEKALKEYEKGLPDLSNECDEIDIEELFEEIQSKEKRRLPTGRSTESPLSTGE